MHQLDLTADMLTNRGRIVTDHTTATVPTMADALQVARQYWQRYSRRRGTQLHVRITTAHGPIVTQRYRRD
jgi:hypothetical protein